jgi:hypothetical protein
VSVNAVEYVINAQNRASGALNAAASSMRRLAGSTSGAATAMKTLAAVQIGSMLASGFSTATNFVTGYVKALADAKDQLNDVANRTGIAVESLQSLGFAAKMAGIENFTGAMQKFTVQMGKALSSGNTEAFAKLGLNFQELARMAPDEQFRAVAEAIGKLPTETERAAAAVALFGKSGAEMVPLFTSNLAEAEQQARNLGMVLSGNQVSAIADMNDALDTVQMTIEGIIAQVTSNLAPVVTAMSQEFLSFVEGFKGVGGATGGNALADTITTAFFDIAAMFAEMFDAAVLKFADFGAILQSFVSGLQTVINVFVIAIETMKIAFNVFVLAGSGISYAIGTLLEGLGWFSKSLGDFGKELREGSQQNISETVDSMNKSGERIGKAMAGTLFDSASRPGGPGAAASAVEQAREAFGRIRQGTDPAAEEAKRQAREASVMNARRDAAQKEAAEKFRKVIDESAKAQKEIGSLVERRDKMLAERAERMNAKSPENQAVIDRFGSRGPYMQANERTAKATEELAKINQQIYEKQETIQKAALETAKNTSGFLALGTV